MKHNHLGTIGTTGKKIGAPVKEGGFGMTKRGKEGGDLGMTPWCDDLVCSWRRLLADRHSLPFPWTLSLHRRWCPSASHHPLTFLFLLALTFRTSEGSVLVLLKTPRKAPERHRKGPENCYHYPRALQPTCFNIYCELHHLRTATRQDEAYGSVSASNATKKAHHWHMFIGTFVVTWRHCASRWMHYARPRPCVSDHFTQCGTGTLRSLPRSSPSYHCEPNVCAPSHHCQLPIIAPLPNTPNRFSSL